MCDERSHRLASRAAFCYLRARTTARNAFGDRSRSSRSIAATAPNPCGAGVSSRSRCAGQPRPFDPRRGRRPYTPRIEMQVCCRRALGVHFLAFSTTCDDAELMGRVYALGVTFQSLIFQTVTGCRMLSAYGEFRVQFQPYADGIRQKQHRRDLERWGQATPALTFGLRNVTFRGQHHGRK